MHAPVRVCFVCSGNICRSPTAQVALVRQAAQQGLTELVQVDSAGTGAWHVGEDMDARARRTMTHAGWDVGPHAAAQFTAADFATHDVVVALDTGHYNALWWLAAETDDAAATDADRAKLVLLRTFDPQLAEGEAPEVGDPYYGGPNGFREVLEQIERSTRVLLEAIRVGVQTGEPLAVPDTPGRGG